MFNILTGLGFGIRHLQCFMVFLGWATVYSVRANLSLAIVPMTASRNGMKPSEHPEFLSAQREFPITNYYKVLPWTEQMQGSILSAFFWGYTVSQVPGGQLSEKFGPKVILAGSLFTCGLITVLTPFAAVSGGFYCMIGARVFLGLMQGLFYPSVAFFLSKWVPTPERGRLICFVMSGNQFGNLVTPAVAGILADSRWGWPSIFYVSGGFAIFWALLYFYLGADSPHDHKTISESERSYILQSLPDNSSNRAGLKTPWKAMAKSGPVWAVLITLTCESWGFFTLLTQIPRYISGVFGSNITSSGFMSALPYASSFLLLFVYAAIGDALTNKKILPLTTSKKIWNTYAMWGPALSLFLLAFAGTDKTLALCLLVSSVAMNSAVYLGISSNQVYLSPNFSGTLMGISMTFGNISSLAAPLYVGYIVSDRSSVAQWQIVFLTAAATFFVGNLVFLIFGSAEVQPWNFPPKERENVETAEIASKNEEEKRQLQHP